MEKFKVRYKPFGSIALLLEWSEEINQDIVIDIVNFKQLVNKELKEFVLECVPAYNSLTIFFDTSKIKYSGILKKVKALYEKKKENLPLTQKVWKIPVCYEDSFALDIKLMSKKIGIEPKDLINKHSNVVYDVCFIGFLPGFLYLSGLNPELSFPRKTTPRKKIKKGDVAIAANQTGIYPQESPGGWNIIGNSPIELFDVTKNPPCFAKSGDKVKFYSISSQEHELISEKLEKGIFNLEFDQYEQ